MFQKIKLWWDYEIAAHPLLAGIFYAVKRHVSPIVMLLVGLAIGFYFGDAAWYQDVLRVAVGKMVNIGIGVSAALLITKFVFNKIQVQETVKNDPIAVAILIGCIYIFLALQF
jgi:hypothetical protein